MGDPTNETVGIFPAKIFPPKISSAIYLILLISSSFPIHMPAAHVPSTRPARRTSSRARARAPIAISFRARARAPIAISFHARARARNTHTTAWKTFLKNLKISFANLFMNNQ